MKKTVAIVGSHPDTREQFDVNRRDCDVWVFNEAMKEDWCSYATGVFQIHKPVIWRSATNRNDPNHYEWLKSGDTPTIFMQDEYEDVPQSERFPLDEMKEMFPRSYFTSSPAFAIALAIYKGYERIELYGVEMETNTEYAHQRTGVAYWIGYAEAKGIEVEHISKGFWDAPLYAYEDDVVIPMGIYEDRIAHFEDTCKQAERTHLEYKTHTYALLDAWVESYKADLSNLDGMIKACGQTAANFGAIDGAKQVNERYLDKCKTMREESGSYLIVRQEFEGQMRAGGKKQQEHTENLKKIAATLKEKRQRLNGNDAKAKRELIVAGFKNEFEEYIKENTMMGMGNGIAIENMNLIKYFDALATATEPLEIEVEKNVLV
jgi:hypothetical protein